MYEYIEKINMEIYKILKDNLLIILNIYRQF